MSRWIDFKLLRERLDILRVLDHYGVAITSRRGDQVSCLCPLPDHPIRHEPGKRTASFSADVRRGIWQCFGCTRSGNALDLVLELEGRDRDDPNDVLDVALDIADRFGIDCDGRRDPNGRAQDRDARDDREDRGDRHAQRRRGAQRRRQRNGSTQLKKAVDASTSTAWDGRAAGGTARAFDATEKDTIPGHRRHHDSEVVDGSAFPVVINAPLEFTLDHLDPTHPYLAQRGLRADTVAHFGLGFCSRGMLKDRIAIPLHTPHGVLVGYAGRVVDDACISDDSPKYRFPGTRERDGKRYEFRKAQLCYNANRIAGPIDDLIVVEGFASVWHLHQLGHTGVVALMGASCSADQAEIITSLVTDAGRIWLMPDSDPAGEKCAESALKMLAPHRFCRWVRLKPDRQPTDVGETELLLLTSVEVPMGT
ncbi:MAG: CHC2 zinc finger domain-containing protein [Tepidisphaeraceae bacterium]